MTKNKPKPAQEKHDCGKEIMLVPFRYSAQDGQEWTCSCGKTWVHVCDEAEGCYWEPKETA